MARFIVADDSFPQRLWLTSALVDDGHDVLGQASDGQEALALCRQFHPDFVVLDLNMPQLTGNEAAQIIVNEKLAGHVIILSLNTQESLKAPLEAIGCTFIKKPLHEKERFIQLLEPLLHR